MSYAICHVQITDAVGIDTNTLVENSGGFENYLKNMSKAGTWGDGVTLAAAACLYQRPITIITDTNSKFTINSPTATDKNAEPLLLGYTGTLDNQLQNHYVALSQKARMESTLVAEAVSSSSEV